MTSLERRVDYSPGAVEASLTQGAASLVSWAHEADAAYQLAQRLVSTSFCPQAFRGKPDEAAAAMLSGAEVGLSPMASLRSFDVIQGQAAPRALTLRAVAQSHGCEFVTVSETPDKVVIKGRRRGQAEWETVTWTMDRARSMSLHTKDNWKKQPQAMLVARATAELARRIAADAILGIGYTVEELDEDEAPTSKRTVSRKSKAAAAPEPDEPSAWAEPQRQERGQDRALRPVADVGLPPLPGEETEPVIPDPPSVVRPDEPVRPPGSITQPQMRMMMALLKKAGLDERDERLDYCRAVIGREIESSSDLTKGEAQQILDRLVALTDNDPEPGFDDEPHPDEFIQLPYKDD